MRLPAVESEPISRMRITHTISATNTGTTLLMVDESIIERDSMEWLVMAIETPDQVSTAFMVAASSQAQNMYHTSFDSCRPVSGVNRRAMPAKSMAQKASARIVGSDTVRKRGSRLVSAGDGAS